MTPSEGLRKVNEILDNYPEKVWDRRLIQIWGAKRRSCQKCGAPPFKPCRNVSNYGPNPGKPNRWPHDVRIDWERIITALHEKGYYAYGER